MKINRKSYSAFADDEEGVALCSLPYHVLAVIVMVLLKKRQTERKNRFIFGYTVGVDVIVVVEW